MRCVLGMFLGILVASAAWSQVVTTPPLPARMLQLMESTAVATPGLLQAAAPVKQSADATLASMERTPGNAALTWQFMTEVKAYLALADSMPRPNPFPQTADQQYAELREDLQKLQRLFEGILDAQNHATQVRDADPNQLNHYAEADAKAGPPGAIPRIVFLGDSITEAWRLNEYFPGRDLVNRGIGDQTTGQMLARFRQDVVALNPKAVVILGGAFDAADGIALNQIEDNLTMMGDLAKAHGIRPAFASVLPPKEALPAIRTLNQWIESYCASQGFFYINYFPVMADSAGLMLSDMSDDGIHPNAKGYRVMSPAVQDALGRVLAPESPVETKRRFKLLGR